MKKLIFFLLLHLCFTIPTIVVAQNLYQCGIYKKATVPAEPKFIDNFGNYYSEEELSAKVTSSSNTLSTNDCTLTKFDISFASGAFTKAEELTICSVFKYLEDKVVLNVPNVKARIEIKKAYLDDDVLGNASLYYPINNCGIQQSTMLLTFLGSKLYEKKTLGTITLNSLFDGKWHNDTTPLTTNWHDLYSLVLHEALHILGFSTAIHPLNLPSTGVLTTWDKFLFNKNSQNNLSIQSSTKDCCTNHLFNPKEINTNLSNNCQSNIWFKDKSGNEIAPISCHENTNNGLSHLGIKCDPSSPPFVMNPILPNNTKRRVLTTQESKIICALGYKTTLTPTCTPSNIIALDDCDPTIYTSIAQKGSLNVVFNDIFPTNYKLEIVSWDTDGLENVSITTPNSTISYTIKNRGEWFINYKLTNLDNNECVNAKLKIVCIDKNLSSCCSTSNCNLTCFGDFENFTSSFEARYYLSSTKDFCNENPFIMHNTEGVNTIDLLTLGTNYIDYCDKDKIKQSITAPQKDKYLGFWAGYDKNKKFSSEGFYLPLCRVLKKDTKVKVDFIARVNPECIALLPEMLFSFVSKIYGSGAGSVEHAKIVKTVLIKNSTFVNFSFDYTVGEDVVALLISANAQKYVYFNIDDIKISEYDVNLSIQSKILSNCIDDNIEIEYSICSTNSQQGDLAIQATIPNGYSVAGGSFNPQGVWNVQLNSTNQPNPFCAKGKLILKPMNTVPNGTILNISLKATSSQKCTVIIGGANTTDIKLESCKPDCACSPTTSYTIAPVAGQLNTLLSSTAIFKLNNSSFSNANTGCILVTGNLIIDKNYNFSSCNFVMATGSKIEIAAGVNVNFDKCRFYSCNQMWKGIEALASSTIRMTNCPRVEDAHFAIKLNNQVSATITNNVFSKNYVDIYTDGSVNAISLKKFEVLFNVHNALNNSLKAPYSGQPIPSKWTTTYAAYWFKRTSVLQTPVNIGRSALPGTVYASINGATNGIIAENTSIFTHGVEFKNVLPTANYTVGQAIQGFAVHSSATLAGITTDVVGMGTGYTAFNNCTNGIYAKNSLLNVRNNTMNPVSNAISGEFLTSTVNTDGTINIGNINDNSINCTTRGIYLNQTPTQYILNNDVTCSSKSPTTASCIWLNNCGATSSSELVIRENILQMSNIAYGIRLANCKNITIHNNKDITINSSRKGTGSVNTLFTDGINIINSESCNIVANRVVKGLGTPNDPLNTAETVGLFMQNAPNNLYCCNSTDELHTGMEVRGLNDITDGLIGTLFGNHDRGLWLRKINANAPNPLIGGQGHRGNEWLGNSATNDAINDDNFIQGITKNQILVETPQGTPLFPSKISLPNVPIGTDWFQEEKGASLKCTIASTHCISMKPTTSINALDQLLFKGLSKDELNPITSWQLQKNLYKKLQVQPSLAEKDIDAQIFFEEAKNSPIATFVGVEESFDYIKSYKSEEQKAIEVTIAAQKEKLSNILDKLAEGEEVPTLIEEIRNLEVALEQSYKALNNTALRTEKESMESLLALQERLNHITVEQIHEQNLLEVQKIQVAQLLAEDKQLEEKSIYILESVANQCDAVGGEAVQTARAMLTWHNADKYSFERETSCNEEILFKTKRSNYESVKIYPNPTDGNIILEKKTNDIAELSIFDMNGRLVKSMVIQEQKTPINVNYLQNGVYYCRLIEKTGDVVSVKISIIR